MNETNQNDVNETQTTETIETTPETVETFAEDTNEQATTTTESEPTKAKKSIQPRHILLVGLAFVMFAGGFFLGNYRNHDTARLNRSTEDRQPELSRNQNNESERRSQRNDTFNRNEQGMNRQDNNQASDVKLSEAEAKTIAQEAYPDKTIEDIILSERGTPVYRVIFENTDKQQVSVVIDANTGTILETRERQLN